jgi:hypothetical protein
MWLLVAALVTAGLLVFGLAVSRVGFTINSAQQFARAGYCSVPGNLSSDGTPLVPGTFLDLTVSAAESSSNYSGAVPANFVEGVGLTCAAPQKGYVRDGFAGAVNQVTPGIYPYYRPGR